MQFYVSKNGQRYGPYSLEELRHEVLANVFRPENFASSDNGQTWEPISAIPGIGPLAYAVEADTANNLLVIRYRDGVGSSDVERCAVEVSKALTSLEPGFRLLADFTDLESMDAACAPHLRHIMRLCNEKGGKRGRAGDSQPATGHRVAHHVFLSLRAGGAHHDVCDSG